MISVTPVGGLGRTAVEAAARAKTSEIISFVLMPAGGGIQGRVVDRRTRRSTGRLCAADGKAIAPPSAIGGAGLVERLVAIGPFAVIGPRGAGGRAAGAVA